MSAKQRPPKGAVVVTGASTGIGAACARRLDRLGFTVFAGVLEEDGAASQASSGSDRMTILPLDVTDEASIAQAAHTVATAVGEAGLAGLVNNAGISIAGPLEFLPLPALRRQLDVNVLGQIAVTQAFLPLLRQGHGRIVIMGSVAGRVAAPFSGPYCASKFAMEALGAALRMELRPWNLPVSIVEPAAVATPIWERSIAATNKLMRELPQVARDRYGAAIDATCVYTDRAGRAGLSPEVVVQAIVEALTATRPRKRYVVGRNGWRAELLRLVPEAVREELLLRYTGLPRQA